MEPSRARRIAIPLIIGIIALLVVVVPRLVAPSRTTTPTPQTSPATQQGSAGEQQAKEGASSSSARGEETLQSTDDPAATESGEQHQPEPAAAHPDGVSLSGLHAERVEPDQAAQSLGTLDQRYGRMLVEFTTHGAGIRRITLSSYWQTAWAKRQAEAHYRSLTEDPGAEPPSLPDDQWRYVLTEQVSPHGVDIPALAARDLIVRDPVSGETHSVPLSLEGTSYVHWRETSPGRFELIVVNDQDEPVLRLSRQFTLGSLYDITLEQRVENLTGRDLVVRWRQFGPSEIHEERARYYDSRRFRFGYQHSLSPSSPVLSEDRKLIIPRGNAIKQFAVPADPTNPDRDRMWPTERTLERGYHLSWFGVTSRYFTLTVHPRIDDQQPTSRTLTDVVSDVRAQASSDDRASSVVVTSLVSPERTLAADGTESFDIGIYAGPMNRSILYHEPYVSIGMDELILYMMSTFCAICTFQWLAHILMGFLTLLHDYVLFDWGLAIIALVCVVRLLLHPITKRSQINMMRFGKKMQKMGPEMQKLQKKYDTSTKEGRQKMQQEQMRLFREHGVNPLQAVGCLPMFLQFPIWVALYAMLYFAFDLRQQPAFFGIFQWISGGTWPFLADLASGDHFFGEFTEPIALFGFYTVTGGNLLPILLGVVFFIQQKYMTPPPSPTMTPEQVQQQKIMRIMMVVLMPLALYPAPAGLTMYILTSSIIGIIESRYVRAHVDQMDLEGPEKEVKKKKSKKPRDAQGRAYADALERAKRKQSEKKKGPPPSWKKRK